MFINVCAGGWVHSISFSANGERLAWVGHDSSVCVVDAANSQQSVVHCSPHALSPRILVMSLGDWHMKNRVMSVLVLAWN